MLKKQSTENIPTLSHYCNSISNTIAAQKHFTATISATTADTAVQKNPRLLNLEH